MQDEQFELVDEEDRVIGLASRAECHGNPALIHRAVHVLLFNRRGDLLLQKRSRHKDIQPGRWDTSVGGHLAPGESYLEAARREMGEELGLTGLPLTFLYYSRLRNAVESENIATFHTCCEAAPHADPQEIEELRFWTRAAIDAALGRGLFTPHFEEEWATYKTFERRYVSGNRTGPGFCAGDSFPGVVAGFPSDQ